MGSDGNSGKNSVDVVSFHGKLKEKPFSND
jgi:hypothetical protein